MVKIRLTGTREVVDEAILALTATLKITNISDYYKNHDGTVRVYLDAKIQ